MIHHFYSNLFLRALKFSFKITLKKHPSHFVQANKLLRKENVNSLFNNHIQIHLLRMKNLAFITPPEASKILRVSHQNRTHPAMPPPPANKVAYKWNLRTIRLLPFHFPLPFCGVSATGVAETPQKGNRKIGENTRTLPRYHLPCSRILSTREKANQPKCTTNIS